MGKILTVGSLFSGIGGFDLGLERAGMKIQWQVENNDFCRRILQKHWPTVPCHYDITTIDWHWIPRVDLVCGGFPCQPFSCAGWRRGAADDRYIWPEVVRCLDALRPAWFLGENVPGIIKMALDQVCADLESLGYQVWPVCVPACAVDTPHIRQRLWILAYCNRSRRERQNVSIRSRRQDETEIVNSGNCKDVADANTEHGEEYKRWHQFREEGHKRIPRRSDSNEQRIWPVEPDVGRVVDGVPHRVDRLRGLGNAVVPQIVEALGRMILEVENYGPGS